MDALLALILGFGSGLIMGTILAVGWHDRNLERMRTELKREFELRLMALNIENESKRKEYRYERGYEEPSREVRRISRRGVWS
jgi:hypothetical protein